MTTTTLRSAATPVQAPRAGAPCRPALRPPARPGAVRARRLPPGSPPAGPARRRRRIRLTGRGRVLLVLVVATLLAVAFSIGRASSTASSQSGQAQSGQAQSVQAELPAEL